MAQMDIRKTKVQSRWAMLIEQRGTMRCRPLSAAVSIAVVAIGCSGPTPPEPADGMQWLAGDHHTHSRYSVLWDQEVEPWVAAIGAHGVYPIPLNALMAKHYGLSWMVITDHGGLYHAKINLEQAYPNLLVSREVVPEVIQFFGVELNSPGADHSSIIFPHTHDEAERVYQVEYQFDRLGRRSAYPSDPGSNTEARMLEALRAMNEFPERPVVIANHPSRSAMGGALYGLYTPEELREWNDAAPDVAVGMVGSPGHQAISINPDGSLKSVGRRGDYSGQPTRGGFDPMTARLGGFWDSMLGEGRRWWITANSDSHRHWTDGGIDFWPGEYSKTYVYADQNYDDILDALRTGRVFVTTGDLVTELYVTAATTTGDAAGIGGTLSFEPGASVIVVIRIRDPASENSHGDSPIVRRIDLIGGEITGISPDPALDTNPSTRVIRRFSSGDWTQDGEFLTMTERLDDVNNSFYLRVRGTNTDQLEPEPDLEGEDPWADLWFYSNPIFLELE